MENGYVSILFYMLDCSFIERFVDLFYFLRRKYGFNLVYLYWLFMVFLKFWSCEWRKFFKDSRVFWDVYWDGVVYVGGYRRFFNLYDSN